MNYYLFFSLIALSFACPERWLYVRDLCVYKGNELLTYNETVTRCGELGGYPLLLSSAWQIWLFDRWNTSGWLGLEETAYYWMWIDGSPVDIVKGSSPKWNGIPIRGYVEGSKVAYNGTDLVALSPDTKLPLTCGQRLCPFGWYRNKGCYKTYDVSLTFSEASAVCQSVANASLIMPSCMERVETLASQDQDYWVGLIKNGTDLRWVDGLLYEWNVSIPVDGMVNATSFSATGVYYNRNSTSLLGAPVGLQKRFICQLIITE